MAGGVMPLFWCEVICMYKDYERNKLKLFSQIVPEACHLPFAEYIAKFHTLDEMVYDETTDKLIPAREFLTAYKRAYMGGIMDYLNGGRDTVTLRCIEGAMDAMFTGREYKDGTLVNVAKACEMGRQDLSKMLYLTDLDEFL